MLNVILNRLVWFGGNLVPDILRHKSPCAMAENLRGTLPEYNSLANGIGLACLPLWDLHNHPALLLPRGTVQKLLLFELFLPKDASLINRSQGGHGRDIHVGLGNAQDAQERHYLHELCNKDPEGDVFGLCRH